MKLKHFFFFAMAGALATACNETEDGLASGLSNTLKRIQTEGDRFASRFNNATGEWDECKRYTLNNATGLGESEITLPDLQDYLMDGFLYCRFEKLGTDDSYADIDTPTITMEGRVE